MAQIALRIAKPDDARAIAAIHVAAWRAAYRRLMPDDFLAALSVDQRTAMWSSILSRPTPAQVMVAEIDSVLAGFCSYGPTRDDAAKRHPCLVPYADLSEDEKKFDRQTAMKTLQAILALGYSITRE